ncbi:MAG: hypothetical protein HKL96_09080 [Phycisphaerales bacterium]|nr:hypothetical protein [Phycisphaerales bacterium]
MHDVKPNHQHQRQEHAKDHQHHDANVAAPYWKRAHRDWRFWFALMLMLGAMVAYVITEDEALRSSGPPQQSVPAMGG